MSYQVLARKYRPSNFKELRGQKALVQIFTNTVKQNKIPHAYLLTGIRGIGKTTIARIIAKTINCTNLNLDNEIIIPCEQCDNCTSVQNANHPDIIELDAASKTGVNDVREIIEATKFKSLLGKYKVYIIDEVHMLSSNAFNALLKTLEEPPEHIVFIFATTEFKKIPLTIISRCQKFNLHRFTISEITQNIESICKTEKIRASIDSLNLIAKFSDGSIRDSLSLLETMNMYKLNDEEITEILVNQVLGLPNISESYKLLHFIIIGNPKEAISTAKALYIKGIDSHSIIEELLQLCSKISKHLAIDNFIKNSDMSDYERSLLQAIANKTDVRNITSIWRMLFKGIEELKYTRNSLDTLDILIIRICHMSTLPSIEQLIQKSISSSSPEILAKTNLNQPELSTFKNAVQLFYEHKELVLYYKLIEEIHLISYEKGKIEAKANKYLPLNFTKQVIEKLNEWTDISWKFILSDTLNKATQTIKDQETTKIESDKLVKDILESFPGAKLKNIVKVT